ncbi:HORMA-1 domain-containing protein [Nocardia goodfellowii]
MVGTFTASSTFTITDAQYVASKMGADLLNLNARYGHPTREQITDFVLEAALYLKAGYLATVDYGFKDGDRWILRLRYRAIAGGQLGDASPGGLPSPATVTGSTFHSYLIPNAAFTALTSEEKRAFKDTLPFQRTGGSEPTTGVGDYTNESQYSRNGVGLNRDVFSAA